MKHDMKPKIPAMEVEKAEAIAGVGAAQSARARGYDPAAMRAMASLGKSTWVGELELLPLGLQVQLCLMEHAKLYAGEQVQEGDMMMTGLKRLTRLAYCFAQPDEAYDTLTLHLEDEAEKRRQFDREAFALAKQFEGAEEIERLNAHIAVQMGLLEEASPPLPEASKKKLLREKPPGRRARRT